MSRLDYWQVAPDLFSPLLQTLGKLEFRELSPKLRALVELRVSQINGCVFCCEKHSRELRELGEDQQRLDVLPSWHESEWFSAQERAALDWAEELTKVAATHGRDSKYEALLAQCGDRLAVELSLVIAQMNFWNRLAVGFRKQPVRQSLGRE